MGLEIGAPFDPTVSCQGPANLAGSAEEERVVLELQATIGNKWATIASYLPGRTDNDVKNFWSSRQKRLSRILLSPSRSSKNKGKSLAVDEFPNSEVPKLRSTQLKEEEQYPQYRSSSSSFNWDNKLIKMKQLPSSTIPNLFNMKTNVPFFETTNAYTEPSIESQFEFSLFETNGMYGMGFTEPDFLDAFRQNELVHWPQLNVGCTSYLVENDSLENPDGFFEDFPIDLLEHNEKIPSSSPP
ncbi:hypothetical protein LguiA_015416 [Lonicera macranthoides]